MRDAHPWGCPDPQTIKFQRSLLCPGSSRQEGLAKESGRRMWYLGVLDSWCQEEAELLFRSGG